MGAVSNIHCYNNLQRSICFFSTHFHAVSYAQDLPFFLVASRFRIVGLQKEGHLSREKTPSHRGVPGCGGFEFVFEFVLGRWFNLRAPRHTMSRCRREKTSSSRHSDCGFPKTSRHSKLSSSSYRGRMVTEEIKSRLRSGVAHEVARSRQMAALFYEELIALRRPATPALHALKLSDGFVCDPTANRCAAAADAPERYPTAWLPTERLANAGRAVTTGTPF